MEIGKHQGQNVKRAWFLNLGEICGLHLLRGLGYLQCWYRSVLGVNRAVTYILSRTRERFEVSITVGSQIKPQEAKTLEERCSQFVN